MVGFINSPKGVVVGYSIGSMYVFSLKYVLSTTKAHVQEDVGLSDAQTGLLYTMFVLAIMVACPVLGCVADMAQAYKKYLAIGGLILDAVAMCACAICHNFYVLLIPRILSGIGDGTFSTLAPTLLSDYFPPTKRSLILTIFLSISNIGSAIGFVVAGSLGDLVGWRYTCVILGLPGLFALLLFVFADPAPDATEEKKKEEEEGGRYGKVELNDIPVHESPLGKPLAATTSLSNSNDSESENSSSTNGAIITSSDDDSIDEGDGLRLAEAEDGVPEGKRRRNNSISSSSTVSGGFFSDIKKIFTAPYVSSVVGFLFIGFAIASIADWGTTFFVRYYELSTSTAGTLCGGVTVICALLGTVLGGFICEYAVKALHRHPQLLVSSTTLIASCFFFFPGLLVSSVRSPAFACVMFGLGIILCYIYYGPMNAYVINCVHPNLRSRALGVTYAFRHFGGAIAPSIVGTISDAHLGDLRTALIVSPLGNLVAGFIWLLAYATIPVPPAPKKKNASTSSDEMDEHGNNYDYFEVKKSIQESDDQE